MSAGYCAHHHCGVLYRQTLMPLECSHGKPVSCCFTGLHWWNNLSTKSHKINHTKGQGHTWDLNSDLLMSPSVYAPSALVCLVPHLTPDSFSCLQPLPAAGDALCCLQHVPTGNVSPCRTFSQKAGGAHRCVWRKRPGHGLFSKSVALWAG